jgi:flagellar biosynthesis/type III secretory pathway chaperone
MSNYFEGEVLESAKRAVKDIKIKAWEELKSEVEEKHVQNYKILEMMDAKQKLVEEHQHQGPAWRFSGVPREDVHSVQWMVGQEQEVTKQDLLKRVEAHNEELQSKLDKKTELLAQLQHKVQEEYRSLVAGGEVASSTRDPSPEV